MMSASSANSRRWEKLSEIGVIDHLSGFDAPCVTGCKQIGVHERWRHRVGPIAGIQSGS
jgi:hypothetical protein